MNNEAKVAVNGRDIYFRTDGALTGDILTVACLLVWADDKSPIDSLTISRSFMSGNNLPGGNATSFNEYYDPLTGIYWFDIKLTPITGPVELVLQTSGVVDGEDIPVRFYVSLSGPSPLTVTPITFDGEVMRFEVGTTEGKLLRYPLALKAVREIDGTAVAIPSKEKRIPYAFYTPINNGEEETYAVMGTAEVDGVQHNWVVKTKVKTNDAVVEVTQVGKNLLGVSVVLADSNAMVTVNLPVKFQFDNGTYGIANQIQDFSIIDGVIHFDVPISDVKDQGIVNIKLHLNEINNQNAPIFLTGRAPVKRWSNGQSDINIVIDSHTYKRKQETLYAHIFWKDGTPVVGFRLTDVTGGCESGVVGNKIILSRKVVPNPHQQNTLTLTGNVDLSPFGIEKSIPFEDSILVGSDVLPARVTAGLGTVVDDEVHFSLFVRQNNGDIFNSVTLDKFNNGAAIESQNYDADQGILSFTVPNTAIEVEGERAPVKLNFIFNTDNPISFSYSGSVKIDVVYKVTSDLPVWSYRKDPVTGQVYIESIWSLCGTDNKYPMNAEITELTLNGVKAITYKKMYNQSFGALAISIPVDLKNGDSLFIAPIATASGLGNFIHLPPIDARYREPGTAQYVEHEFIGDSKVNVYFSLQGWISAPPSEVQLNDESWDKQKGVKLGKTYSEYDPKKGLLMVQFDIYDINSPVFEAATTMKFSFADQTVYPINFSFTK